MSFSPRAEFSFQDAIEPGAEFSFVGSDGGQTTYRKQLVAQAMEAELAQQQAMLPQGPQYFQYGPIPGIGAAPGVMVYDDGQGAAAGAGWGRVAKGLVAGAAVAAAAFLAWRYVKGGRKGRGKSDRSSAKKRKPSRESRRSREAEETEE